MRTLTQRYIDEVVSHLPEATRPDISRELQALISDMVDERSVAGHSFDPAERSALEELGDPARLAARYRDAPNYLIGPRLYPSFVAGLRWLLPLVAFIALAVNVMVRVTTDPELQLGALIGAAIGGVLTAVFTVAGVLTLVFAIVERTLPRAEQERFGRSGGRAWSVDDLNEERPGQAGVRSDAIAGLVFVAFMALVPLVPTGFLYVAHLNDGGPFVNQALWDFWLPVYYVLLGLEAAVEAWDLVTGRWSLPQLLARAAVSVAFAVYLTSLFLTQQVLDPAIPLGDVPRDWTIRVTVAVVWLVTVWSLVDIGRKWRTRQPAGTLR
jgi:hypothetical protein